MIKPQRPDDPHECYWSGLGYRTGCKARRGLAWRWLAVVCFLYSAVWIYQPQDDASGFVKKIMEPNPTTGIKRVQTSSLQIRITRRQPKQQAECRIFRRLLYLDWSLLLALLELAKHAFLRCGRRLSWPGGMSPHSGLPCILSSTLLTLPPPTVRLPQRALCRQGQHRDWPGAQCRRYQGPGCCRLPRQEERPRCAGRSGRPGLSGCELHSPNPEPG